MSTSSELAVKMPEKLPAKRSPSWNCSPLARFFEENNVASSGKPVTFQQTVTPLNLFPENPILDSIPENQPNQSPKSMDFFPQFADSSTKMFDATEEHKTAQMTIFYGGQVILCNDFPADKAKEIMVLASKGSGSQQFTPRPTLAPKILNNQLESNARVPPSPSMSSDRFRASHQWPVVMQIAPPLPVARRSSLQRFLTKRRGRNTARSPCPVPDKSASSKPTESGSWVSSVAAESASSEPSENRSWLSLAARQ